MTALREQVAALVREKHAQDAHKRKFLQTLSTSMAVLKRKLLTETMTTDVVYRVEDITKVYDAFTKVVDEVAAYVKLENDSQTGIKALLE
jgi:hypothetical protein